MTNLELALLMVIVITYGTIFFLFAIKSYAKAHQPSPSLDEIAAVHEQIYVRVFSRIGLTYKDTGTAATYAKEIADEGVKNYVLNYHLRNAELKGLQKVVNK